MRKTLGLILIAGALMTTSAFAADKTLKNEREKFSYMVGMDVGKSIAPAAADLDPAALEKAIRNALAGNKPLVSGAAATRASEVMKARVASRKRGKNVGALPKDVSKQTISYLVGHAVGTPLTEMKADFDLAPLMQGALDRMSGQKTQLSDDQAAALRNAYIRKNMDDAARAGADYKRANEAFLQKNKAEDGVTTTASGLQYKILKQGAGAAPLRTSTVRVKYEGRLIDGSVFDASANAPAEFPLNRVIQGWTEGLQLMKPGSKFRFFIPAYLAYGEKGASSSIPPNSTLIFDVELISVVR